MVLSHRSGSLLSKTLGDTSNLARYHVLKIWSLRLVNAATVASEILPAPSQLVPWWKLEVKIFENGRIRLVMKYVRTGVSLDLAEKNWTKCVPGLNLTIFCADIPDGTGLTGVQLRPEHLHGPQTAELDSVFK